MQRPAWGADVTRTAVLALIGAQGPVSRAELARSLKVSAALVTQLTRQLIADNLLEELDSVPSQGGRPARLLGLTSSASNAIGVKVAADHVALVEVQIDGDVVHKEGGLSVVKIAIDPVWHLPGIAERFGASEMGLRRALFEQTGGMYPELVTRLDLQVFLPPIGGTTVYIFGDVDKLTDAKTRITCRVHDECNGSDVFGSDMCTCRPYLIHGIEECARGAQEGGLGIIVYNRKEGRALGEVTKFLVYNARKRQKGGDTAATYFHRTECVAGTEDARFQEFMPDCLHFFGIRKIHNLHSMSNMKYDAIVNSGIEVVNRISIPDSLIPKDAMVEMEAKKAAGYFTKEAPKSKEALKKVHGRQIDE